MQITVNRDDKNICLTDVEIEMVRDLVNSVLWGDAGNKVTSALRINRELDRALEHKETQFE
tara:strand:+ start:103 stop:285 length:183 start_codon:yes stop_codon:yes gene_type:complete